MAAAGLIRTRGAARPLMRLITMSGLPILRQLHLEERLLRFSGDNWCIINDGTAPATIVMGVYGNLKFGGNAQSITKNRWVHHTSFLWDYDVKNMDYLKMPKRAPEYRLARKHTDFLCRMKEYMPSRSVFRDGVITALRHFSVQTTDIETVLSDDDGFVPASNLLSKYDQEEIVSSEKSLRV